MGAWKIGGMTVESVLFSKNLISFYECFEEDINTAKDCAMKMEKAVPIVADELHFGRFDIHINALVSLQ